MLTFTVIPNGNLKISATDEERDEIREMIDAGHDYFRITGQLLEDKLGNGWDWLTPVEAGAMTDDSNVILTDDAIRGENDNEVLYVGRVWHDNFYAVRDWYQKLADDGEVVFWDSGPTEYTDDETTERTKRNAALLLPFACEGEARLRAAFGTLDAAICDALDGLRDEGAGNYAYAPRLRELAMLRQMRARALGDKYVTP